MRIIKKAAVLLLILCAVFAFNVFPVLAEEGVLIDPLLILTPEANLTVFVDGTANTGLSDKYPYEETVTITAPAVSEKTFLYWTNGEGTVISCSNDLTLTMYSDTIVNAVYGDTAATARPAAAFLNITRNSDEIVFNAIATAPAGSTVKEAGIRYSTTKNTLDALKGSDGVTVVKAPDAGTNWTRG